MRWFKKSHDQFVSIGNTLGAYLVFGTLISAFLGFLVKRTKPFTDAGWGWADALLLGLAGFCLLVLIIGAGSLMAAVGYRVMRPSAKVEGPVLAPTTPDNAVERIDRLLQRSNELEDEAASLRRITAEIDIAFGNLRGDQTTLTSKADEALKLAKALRDQGHNHEGRLDAYKDELLSIAGSVNRLNERIRAIAHRESLSLLRGEIDKDEKNLFFPDAIGIEDVDWIGWQKREKIWRSSVQHWSTIANVYVKGDAWTRIKSIPPDDYLGSWSFKDGALPDANTIHQYKTFCIMRRRLSEIEAETNNAVYAAAFG